MFRLCCVPGASRRSLLLRAYLRGSPACTPCSSDTVRRPPPFVGLSSRCSPSPTMCSPQAPTPPCPYSEARFQSEGSLEFIGSNHRLFSPPPSRRCIGLFRLSLTNAIARARQVWAIRQAGERARGGTAYVTLEPCNHFGRTPPCTTALLDCGISRRVGSDRSCVQGRGLHAHASPSVPAVKHTCTHATDAGLPNPNVPKRFVFFFLHVLCVLFACFPPLLASSPTRDSSYTISHSLQNRSTVARQSFDRPSKFSPQIATKIARKN